jgi:HSP20 family protein
MTVPVRRTDGRRPLEVWEPFGSEPWDPITELRSLAQRFSNLVDELTGTWPTDGVVPGASAPLGELEEQDDAYLVRVELPGVKRGDIDIELAGRRLTGRAERKERQRKGLLRRSTRRTGAFLLRGPAPRRGGAGRGGGDAGGGRAGSTPAQARVRTTQDPQDHDSLMAGGPARSVRFPGIGRPARHPKAAEVVRP